MKQSISVAVNLAVTVFVCLMTVGASPSAATAASSVITTVAGTGAASYSGDGSQATAATIYHPNGVAVDSSGNIYIADLKNSRIRKITVATGIITTVAGTGSAGYSGDGAAAISAKLNWPNGVAVDGSGNIYISDWLNNRIRKVTVSTGIITTVAGNGTAAYSGDGAAATLASINNPSGIAVDSTGNNIYIADNLNNRVRKVTSGTISTVAGTGNSGYSGDDGPATAANVAPIAVALDSNGNILIADAINHCIRKVTSGTITTVAGDGFPGFTGDAGPASSAELHSPNGVTAAANGDIYISDSANNRIRKITALTGIITTVAGNGTAGYSGDNGPATSAELNGPKGAAVSSSGKIYIADFTNNRVRMILNSDFTLSASPTTLTVPQGASDYTAITTAVLNGFNAAVDLTASGLPTGASATFNPTPIAAPGSGSSTLTLSAGELTPAGTYPVTVTGTGGGVTHTATVSFTVTAVPNFTISSPGTVTVAQAHSGTAVISTTVSAGFNAEVDLSVSGMPAGVTATFSQNSFNAPGSGNSTLTLSDSGDTPTGTYPITVTGTGGGKTHAATILFTITPPGSIITFAGNGIPGFSGDSGAAILASLDHSNGVAIDGSGNVYIADNANSRIRMVNAATGIITTMAGTGIAAYSGDSGPATQAGLNNPSGVAVDGSGNIFIADTGNNVIRKITVSTGVITTVAGTSTADYTGDGGLAIAATLNFPTGVAVDVSGNIFIADASNNVIRKVTASTKVISTVAGNGTGAFAGDGGSATAASIYFPIGVAVDGSGNIYIADSFNDRVRKVTFSNGFISSLAGTGTAGYTGDGAAATSANLNSPTGVIVDTTGDIYIADASNNRIRKITVATGLITTVAGNGPADFAGDGGPATAASLNFPSGLAIDAGKNIYIADTNNNRIRKVFTSTPASNFSMSASAVSPVAQGASVNSTVSTAVSGGFSAAVSLTASGLPTEATSGFNPISIAAPGSGSSTLTLTAGGSTPAGTYSVTVTGTGGGKTHSATISFTVTAVSSGSTITPSVGSGGLVTPGTPQTVSAGSTSIFTVIPVHGYHISSVTGCGGSLSGVTYTTGPMNGSCTVTALFAKSDVVYDEFAYLQANPDVAAVVKSGGLQSGWVHYRDYGRNEGRPLTPDGYGFYRELPYLLANPDVAAVVKSGGISSGWVHYRDYGKNEGRPLVPAGFNNYSEEAYLAANPDVAAVVKSGGVSSGWVHYRDYGKNEGRPLSPVGYGSFSEAAYLLANTDIAAAVTSGIVSSGWEHYNDYGRNEGRPAAPAGYVIYNESAYLAANPDIAAVVKTGSIIDSGWTHYFLYGKNEGRPLAPVGYANFIEESYLAANTDIAAVVKNGLYGITSGWIHYRDYGKGEGRPLNPANYGSFVESDYLAGNPDLYQALLSGFITSGWQHYSNWGMNEGRKLHP